MSEQKKFEVRFKHSTLSAKTLITNSFGVDEDDVKKSFEALYFCKCVLAVREL